MFSFIYIEEEEENINWDSDKEVVNVWKIFHMTSHYMDTLILQHKIGVRGCWWNIESRCLQGCKARGIKLWAAIAAAAMISAYSSKNLPQYQGEKYAVVTLSDCRPILEPPLTPNDFGKAHFFIYNILGMMRCCHEPMPWTFQAY